MEPQAKKQKTDDDTTPISLVWLDDSVDVSEENIAAQQQLRTLDENLKTFKNDKECEHYVKCQFRKGRIVLIVNGKSGQILVPRVHDFRQIISIYVFCYNKQLHEVWANKYTKIKDVFIQFADLKQRIQMDHFNQNPLPILDSIQIRWTYEIDNQYIISNICIEYLSRMKSSSKDKDEFISLCQAVSKGHPILQEFQESYSSDRALSWLNRDPLFKKILENAFQLGNIETLYFCRFFIRDIYEQFQQHKCTSSIQVYHGRFMPDEQLQQIKKSENNILAMKSFFSTTLDRDAAIAFISDQNQHKPVLFQIEADSQIEGVKPFIKTHSLSDQNDEHEVLFMLGQLFKINEIREEENGITIIKMSLCANENDNPFKNRLNGTDEEADLLGFVQLQCEMSQFLSSSETLDDVNKLLEKHLDGISNDDPDRSRYYDALGNVNLLKNDVDSSLNWYKESLKIKKRILPPNDPQLVESCSKIASIYLHKQDRTEALEAFKQMLTISKQVYGDDHLNLIFYYNNMITIYESEEKYSDVLSCYTQIFNIMLKHYPIDDANFAPIYNNMGKIFVNLNQYHLALGYYKTSLDIKLKTLPHAHESTAITSKNIGIIYESMGNVGQARTYLEQAADIYRQIHSPTHETVLEIEKLFQNMSPSS